MSCLVFGVAVFLISLSPTLEDSVKPSEAGALRGWPRFVHERYPNRFTGLLSVEVCRGHCAPEKSQRQALQLAKIIIFIMNHRNPEGVGLLREAC